MSARNTSTVYRVGRTDGAIDWRLGGRSSDVSLGAGVAFACGSTTPGACRTES